MSKTHEKIGVVIPVYADQRYLTMSRRAWTSITLQTVEFDEARMVWIKDGDFVPIVNPVIKNMNVDWVVVMGADDFLNNNYVSEFRNARRKKDADIYIPKVARGRFGDPTIEKQADWLPETNMFEQNFIIASAPFRKENFLQVGGFKDLPLLEDWHLWAKMFARGATYTRFDGIYHYIDNENSRNVLKSTADYAAQKEIIQEIRSMKDGTINIWL